MRERGQSAWLDDLDRGLLASGELARLIAAGITGLTSNPSTFAKALADRQAYADDVARFRADPQRAAGGREALYEALTIADLRQAADLLRPVWERTGGRDGQVSLELAPRLADDPIGTVDAARRLWIALDRPNAMIKVPGTVAALPAITQLAAEAIP
ncbi:MAG: transaldolase, partial [Burkholderiales bacterium]|nr:transaldolase [Burkholderiales bacterium]